MFGVVGNCGEDSGGLSSRIVAEMDPGLQLRTVAENGPEAVDHASMWMRIADGTEAAVLAEVVAPVAVQLDSMSSGVQLFNCSCEVQLED